MLNGKKQGRAEETQYDSGCKRVTSSQERVTMISSSRKVSEGAA